ncbi:MAG: hypothetical protein INQ03_11265 [Candidatus Heimdallarchaeota archaeon]|nr:hypothetical protein [Candidatus Heimdallarchaeota archaeon]
MEHSKAMLFMAIGLGMIGDIFYLGSFFFRHQMIEFITFLSPVYSSQDLNNSGENMLLIFTSLIGAMMYLVSFLVIALSFEEREKQRQFAYYGILLWFVTDSFASWYFGIGYNVFINIGFLVIATIFLKKMIKEN